MFQIQNLLKEQSDTLAKNLEDCFAQDGCPCHVLSYFGPIHQGALNFFRSELESLASRKKESQRLAILLDTPGGDVLAAESMVELVRHYYKEVFFVVPNQAMSAGTLLCMSGDEIYMDYSSALGPIDPQVLSQGQGKDQRWVPALGYLDKVEELVKKSYENTLSPAEFTMLTTQDIGVLRSYEQARDLSVKLLKEWLVTYKFKNWDRTETKNKKVTSRMRKARAQKIATTLGDNKIWHSHGRRIGLNTLENLLKIRIHDYSEETKLRKNIRAYSDFILEICRKEGYSLHIHSIKGTENEPL